MPSGERAGLAGEQDLLRLDRAPGHQPTHRYTPGARRLAKLRLARACTKRASAKRATS